MMSLDNGSITLDGLATLDVAITEITLTTADGRTITAVGSSKRHPNDEPDPTIGSDLATVRALDALIVELVTDIEHRFGIREVMQATERAIADRQRHEAAAVAVERAERAATGWARLAKAITDAGRRHAARDADNLRFAGIREYAAQLKASGVPRDERLAAIDHYRRYWSDVERDAELDGRVDLDNQAIGRVAAKVAHLADLRERLKGDDNLGVPRLEES